jgi:hypothetical protein
VCCSQVCPIGSTGSLVKDSLSPSLSTDMVGPIRTHTANNLQSPLASNCIWLTNTFAGHAAYEHETVGIHNYRNSIGMIKQTNNPLKL